MVELDHWNENNNKFEYCNWMMNGVWIFVRIWFTHKDLWLAKHRWVIKFIAQNQSIVHWQHWHSLHIFQNKLSYSERGPMNDLSLIHRVYQECFKQTTILQMKFKHSLLLYQRRTYTFPESSDEIFIPLESKFAYSTHTWW